MRPFLTACAASILKAGGEGCQELVMRCTRQEWNKKLALVWQASEMAWELGRTDSENVRVRRKIGPASHSQPSHCHTGGTGMLRTLPYRHARLLRA